MTTQPNFSVIEALESRIAPAAIFTFTDVDGDKVTVKTSKGTDAELAAALTLVEVSPGHQQLLKVDLSSSASFAGTDLLITAKHSPTGDGRVNVGYIDASGLLSGGTSLDLGKIIVKGDLGQIDAGSESDPSPAIKSLSVGSLGLLGLSTQGGFGSLTSSMLGDIGSLKISGDLKDAELNVVGSIGRVAIGGSVLGGAEENSGRIFSTQGLGAVTIKGSILGGLGKSSGTVASEGDLASITVGESITGSVGNESGRIFTVGNIGAVKIGGNVAGGAGEDSGQVSTTTDESTMFNIGSIKIGGDVLGGSAQKTGILFASGTINSVRIDGDLQGATGETSGILASGKGINAISIGGSVRGTSASATGTIASVGAIGTIKIGGDLVGGSISGNESINNSGVIFAPGLGKIIIGGSIISGTDLSTGTLRNSGAISSQEELGSLTVKGSVVGNATNPVLISALGSTLPTGASEMVVIGKLTVGGNVEHTNVLAGYDYLAQAVSGNASIGTVTVGGNWIASSIVAGTQNLGADDAFGGFGQGNDNVNFGDAHDVLISDGNDALIARIAKIQIRGAVFGSNQSGDHFGFTAEQIGVFKVAGTNVLRTSGTDLPFELSPTTGDVTIREL